MSEVKGVHEGITKVALSFPHQNRSCPRRNGVVDNGGEGLINEDDSESHYRERRPQYWDHWDHRKGD